MEKCMKRYELSVTRGEHKLINENSVGTDAVNALWEIAGVIDVEVQSENNEYATISYSYTLSEPYLNAEVLLAKYNLKRM